MPSSIFVFFPVREQEHEKYSLPFKFQLYSPAISLDFQSQFQILKTILANIRCADLCTPKNFLTFFLFYFPLAFRIAFTVNSALHFTSQ
jgi:hypothetical protein